MIPQHPPKKEEAEDWLMSYADMITLLMAFFVMLISMSHLDPVRYEQMHQGVGDDLPAMFRTENLREMMSRGHVTWGYFPKTNESITQHRERLDPGETVPGATEGSIGGRNPGRHREDSAAQRSEEAGTLQPRTTGWCVGVRPRGGTQMVPRGTEGAAENRATAAGASEDDGRPCHPPSHRRPSPTSLRGLSP